MLFSNIKHWWMPNSYFGDIMCFCSCKSSLCPIHKHFATLNYANYCNSGHTKSQPMREKKLDCKTYCTQMPNFDGSVILSGAGVCMLQSQSGGSPHSSPSHGAGCSMPMPIRSTSAGSTPTHTPQDCLAGVGGDVLEAFAQGEHLTPTPEINVVMTS